MNDEFGVSKVVVVGSNGSKDVGYNLFSTRLDVEMNGITYEEIIRLKDFLIDYVKQEEGSHEHKN